MIRKSSSNKKTEAIDINPGDSKLPIVRNNITRVSKNNFITYGIVLAVFLLVQAITITGGLSNLIEGLLVPLCVYAILAVSLNLVVGISGELSLGHAGFMCVGAFSSAIFSHLFQDTIQLSLIRFVLAVVVGAVMAGLFGFIIGMPVLRLRGDYLAIVTLGFGEIIKNVTNILYIGQDENGIHFSTTNTIDLNLSQAGEVIVKGPQGITGTPRDATFLLAVVFLLISLIIILNIINSRTGRAIMAIRDNRIAAESLGINVTKYKMIAFTTAASLAGIAGALYSHNISSLMATTDTFGYNMSIMILVFVVLGGIGSIRGSLISAVVLTLLPELLRDLNDYRMLIYAFALIIMMLFNWAPAALEFRKKASATMRSKLQVRKGI